MLSYQIFRIQTQFKYRTEADTDSNFKLNIAMLLLIKFLWRLCRYYIERKFEIITNDGTQCI